MAQLVKDPPAMRETLVQSLHWEDPLEKGRATHFSILVERIPWTYSQSIGLQRVGQDWATFTCTTYYCISLLFIVSKGVINAVWLREWDYILTYWATNRKSNQAIGTSLVGRWLRITCECRGHAFDSSSRKMPHATGHLGPSTTITEPVLPQWEALSLQQKAALDHQNKRKPMLSNKRP